MRANNIIQQIELSIMKQFHNYCEKQGIKYVLAYGSCIGAIRHKGFIPWDDDIDVLIPIADYEKLISCFKDVSGKYVLKAFQKDNNYIYSFAKLTDSSTFLYESFDKETNLGVYIDLFPVYGLPKNRIVRMIRFWWIQFLEAACISVRQPKPENKNKVRTVMQGLLSHVAGWVGIKRLNQLIIYNATKTQYGESKYFSVLPPQYGKKDIFDFDLFCNRELQFFEGDQFYVPANYDRYLHQLYGDYMKLPPLEERKSHHYNILSEKSPAGESL